MFRLLLIILSVLALAAGLAIGVLNPEAVVIDLVVTQFAAPAGALLLAAFAVGVAAGLAITLLLYSVPSGWRRWRGRRSGSGPSAPPHD